MELDKIFIRSHVSLPPNYANNPIEILKNQKNTNDKLARLSGLDIVRSIACIVVIVVHYFLHTEFKSSEFIGFSMYIQGFFASIVSGSDLYMILTGFLCCNKTFGRNFYYSGIKVLASYLFFSLLTIVVNIYWFHSGMTWKSGLLGILSFSTIPYAWYIEMWIGLFILAPFLNIWYKSLPSKKMKVYLITFIFILSALPDFFNRYNFYLIPQYWENIYPIAFYMAGAFFREYKPIYSKWILILIILSIILINPTITMIIGYPTLLPLIGDRNGVFMATMALCIFLTFYNIEIKSSFIKSIFKNISLRSLDIFLCSATFDLYFYPLFKELYFKNQSQFGLFLFIIVPLIFICCYIIASVKRFLFYGIDIFLKYYNVPFTLQNKG